MFKSSLIRLQAVSKLPQKLAYTPNKYNAKSSAFNLKPVLPDGLFYHPSPSALNPLITPKAFLPDSDIRKTSELYYPEENKTKENVEHMPVIFKPTNPSRYQLSAEDIAELQRLRNENKLSRKQLAVKFGVSPYFISLCTDSNEAKIAKHIKTQQKSMSNWGKRKSLRKQLKNQIKNQSKELWKSNL